MYIHLGQPTHTPAPPKGIVIPAPAPPAGPILQLPRMSLTRVPDTRVEPVAFICRIVTRSYDKPGESIGTGVFVSPYHVLTCAHNIFPPQAPRTKEIIVFPGQNGPDSECHVRANAWAISPGWRGTNCFTAGEDIGIIRVACPMSPGFWTLKPFDVTSLPGATVTLAGYPYGREPKARHMYISRGSITGTIQIQKCTGDMVTGTADGRLLPTITEATNLIAHDLDTAPSQSGSPMWIVQPGGRFLVALHAGRIDENRQGKAVLLNQAVRRRVADWMTVYPPLQR
jgi:V8-like Glu-specific endopeptidase